MAINFPIINCWRENWLIKEIKVKAKAIVVSNNPYSINAIGVIRSLGKENVKTIWIAPFEAGWYYPKNCEPICCPNFTNEENHFIQFLLTLAKRQDLLGAVLIPTSDASLKVISKHKSLLSKRFRPLVCKWSTIKKIIEKNLSYQIAETLGISVPKTYYPKTKDDTLRISKEINYPCLLKPTFSHTFTKKFKRKLFRATDSTELIQTYQQLSKMGFKVMIQEEIPGEDENLVTINIVLNKRSEPLGIFMHRRLVQNPPQYGVVALGESIWEPKIIQPALTLMKSINFEGIAQIEFKWDKRTKEYKFIEINGRSYLSIGFPTSCGLNLIHLAYRNCIGENIAPLTNFSCNYECGAKWVDFPLYIKSLIQHTRMKKQKLKKLVKPLLTRRLTVSVFSLYDPKPLLMELYSLARNFKRIRQILTEEVN